ncbi:ATP-binding protein [Pengzhenrongella sp.]|jgi:predicted kinase|uniref:AAA family ATPase n=1 Tax=Pengzhenrongella sp. TaxID=2888820 RepID=UPI002F92CD8D
MPCALPASGKSTLTKRLALEMPGIRLNPDEWMANLGVAHTDERAHDHIEKCFRQLSQDFLGLGYNVILDWGFWRRSERDEMRLLARSLGVAVELHYLDVPVAELSRRLAIRNAINAHGTVLVDPAELEYARSVFQVPDIEERALFDPHQLS